MAKTKTPFTVSRLKQSDLAPAAYGCAVFIGAVVVFSSKYFEMPLWVLICTPLLVMGAYLAAAFSLPRLALRKDQLGDNMYYLGFMLTLVSLTATLIQYSDDAENEFIVSNFGIALVATIFGILVRSILTQLRKDTVAVERESQALLSEASFKLRGQISQATESFAILTRQIEQITSESVSSISKAHQELSRGMIDIVDEKTQAIGEQSERSAQALQASISQSQQLMERAVEDTARLTRDSQLEMATVLQQIASEMSVGAQEFYREVEEGNRSTKETIVAENAALISRLDDLKLTVTKMESLPIDTDGLDAFSSALATATQRLLDQSQTLASASQAELANFRDVTTQIGAASDSLRQATDGYLDQVRQSAMALSAEEPESADSTNSPYRP